MRRLCNDLDCVPAVYFSMDLITVFVASHLGHSCTFVFFSEVGITNVLFTSIFQPTLIT